MNNIVVKECVRCKIQKEVSMFHKHKKTKDNLNSWCKECVSENSKRHFMENKETLKPIRQKWKIENKDSQKKYYAKRYKEVDKKRLSKYYEDNKDKISIRKKEYNKSEVGIRKRIERDIKNSYRNKYRDSLRSVIRRLNRNKYDFTNNLLGYSDLEFKYHIENQFLENMSWDDRNSFEIDHIIPIVAFNNDTPLNIISSLDNLQPLDPLDNIRKYTSIDFNHINLYIKYYEYLMDDYKIQIDIFLNKSYFEKQKGN